MFEWLDYAFMIRALTATTVLSFSVAPVGAFLVLRRLSLAGEAMAHAIVPGIVIAFVIAGLSVASKIGGGLTAGIAVAALTSLLARMTIIREDASLASLYLIALALGIETAFVATHHVIRIGMIVIAAPLVFRAIRRWARAP